MSTDKNQDAEMERATRGGVLKLALDEIIKLEARVKELEGLPFAGADLRSNRRNGRHLICSD